MKRDDLLTAVSMLVMAYVNFGGNGARRAIKKAVKTLRQLADDWEERLES